MELQVDVDAEDTSDVVTRFRVATMPTFVFLKNGHKVESFSGPDALRVEETIQKFVQKKIEDNNSALVVARSNVREHHRI